MLERMKLRPNTVLHVGDNEAADFDAAVRYGLHAFHLVHHAPWLGENLRLQGTATSLLVPSVRQNQSLPQPFRAMLAMQRHDDKPAPVDVLGYAGAGPLLYAFGRFILDEIQALRTAGHQVKPVFLMRDGHLPQRVAEAIAGGPVGQAIAVSRFAAYAASFRSESDVEKYLAKSTGSGRFELMGQQLLLTPEEIGRAHV